MHYSISLVSDKFIPDNLCKFEDLQTFSKQNANIRVDLFKELRRTDNSTLLYLIPFLTQTQLNCVQIGEKCAVLPFISDTFAFLTDDLDYAKTFAAKLSQLLSNHIFEIVSVQSVITGTTICNDRVSLPNCPVCLKRIDKSVTGFNTINCSDIFHSCCQEKCREVGINCNVCKRLFSSEIDACFDCGKIENIWICLICSKVGCGRYIGGHAHNHFLETGHAFVIKSDSHHIWDYSSDKYVHWTIKSSEGIVAVNQDVNNSVNNTPDPENTTFLNDFNAAQFESQKAFYEERIRAIRANHRLEVSEMLELHKKEVLNLNSNYSKVNHDRNVLSDLSHQLQDQIKNYKSQVSVLTNELATEKKLSHGLLDTVNRLQIEKKTKDADNEELEEQIKDLMKHIEVLDLMSKSGNDSDIVDGKVFIRPPPSSKHGHKKKFK